VQLAGGATAVQTAVAESVLLNATVAALQSVRVAAASRHVICSRTSKPTVGADLPALQNKYNASQAVQQETLSMFVSAVASSDAQIVHLLSFGTSGRADSGFTMAAAAAVTTAGHAVWVPDLDRGGRGLKFWRPVITEHGQADVSVIAVFGLELLLGLDFPLTLEGTRQLLEVAWGSSTAVTAAVHAEPQLLKYMLGQMQRTCWRRALLLLEYCL
jgi:hypothetical protein